MSFLWCSCAPGTSRFLDACVFLSPSLIDLGQGDWNRWPAVYSAGAKGRKCFLDNRAGILAQDALLQKTLLMAKEE